VVLYRTVLCTLPALSYLEGTFVCCYWWSLLHPGHHPSPALRFERWARLTLRPLAPVINSRAPSRLPHSQSTAAPSSQNLHKCSPPFVNLLSVTVTAAFALKLLGQPLPFLFKFPVYWEPGVLSLAVGDASPCSSVPHPRFRVDVFLLPSNLDENPVPKSPTHCPASLIARHPGLLVPQVNPHTLP
jgi:hypothetical protein